MTPTTLITLADRVKNLKLIADNMTEAIFVYDMDKHLVYVNPAFESLTGYTKDELFDINLFSYFHPDDADRFMLKWAQLFDGLSFSQVEYRIITKDNKTRWFSSSWTPIYDDEGFQIGVKGRETDISQRKLIEADINSHMHALGERIKELNCLYGISKLIDNPGISFNEILQGTVDLIPYSWQYPEITCSRLKMNGIDIRTENFVKTNWIQSREILVQNDPVGVLEVYYLEEREQSDEGPFLKEERALIDAIAERIGRVAERKITEDEMVVKDKLAILGQLSGGVSHELRNPLTSISNAVYYLKSTIQTNEEKIIEYLEIISNEVSRAEKIITDLLDYSRTGSADRNPTRVSDFIKKQRQAIVLSKGIKIKMKIPDNLPDIFIDSSQIGQVFENLISNAIQTMPEGGKLTIGAKHLNNQIHLTVADTGGGIAPQNLGKIFQPLFTTRKDGFGLGLATSKTLVEANNGEISVESEEGKGSTFTIILPISPQVD